METTTLEQKASKKMVTMKVAVKTKMTTMKTTMKMMMMIMRAAIGRAVAMMMKRKEINNKELNLQLKISATLVVVAAVLVSI